MNRILRSALWMAAVVLASWTLPAAGQQPPARPASPQRPAVPEKPKKVWINEDLAALRKPWDEYLDQKHAAEQAALEQARAAKESEKAAPQGEAPGGEKPAPAPAAGEGAEPLPATIDETEEQITELLAQVEEKNNLYDSTLEQFNSAPEGVGRDEMEQMLAATQKELQRLQERVKQLKAHVEQLRAKAGVPPPPASPPPSL